MGAGGSVQKNKHHQIRDGGARSPADRKLRTQTFSSASPPEKGIGGVLIIERSLLPSSLLSPRENFEGTQYGWFVETVQYSGQWESYNEESSSRLEAAFSAQENTCLVVHKNRTYTVDLIQMMQVASGIGITGGHDGASGTHRRVKRAPCEVVVDPSSGMKVTTQMRQGTGGAWAEDDPFLDEEEDVRQVEEEGLSARNGSRGEDGDSPSQKNTAQAGGQLPTLVQSIISNENGGVFTMAVSPQSLKAIDSPIEGGGKNKGLIVVTGGKRGFLRSWNASTAEWMCDYAVHNEPTILHTVYSPRGDYIAVGTDDFKAYIFKEGVPSPRHELRGHTGKVYGLSFMSSGSTLVTSSMDSTIRVWDIESGCCTQHQSVQESYVFFIRCSEKSHHLAISGGNDCLLTLHDFRTPTTVAMRCAGHGSTLWYGAIHPQSDDQLASCGKDCTVRLWDTRKGSQALFVLRSHTRPVHCVEYTSCGSYLLSSGRDGRVIGALPHTGESRWIAKASLTTVFRVFYAAEQKKVLSCSSNTVGVWDWIPTFTE